MCALSSESVPVICGGAHKNKKVFAKRLNFSIKFKIIFICFWTLLAVQKLGRTLIQLRAFRKQTSGYMSWIQLSWVTGYGGWHTPREKKNHGILELSAKLEWTFSINSFVEVSAKLYRVEDWDCEPIRRVELEKWKLNRVSADWSVTESWRQQDKKLLGLTRYF